MNKQKPTSQKCYLIFPKQINFITLASIIVNNIVPNQEYIKNFSFFLLLFFQNKKL